MLLLHTHCLSIDGVVLLMRAKKLHKYHTALISDGDNETIFIPRYVEYHTPVFQDASRAVLFLNLCRGSPVGLLCLVYPSF